MTFNYRLKLGNSNYLVTCAIFTFSFLPYLFENETNNIRFNKNNMIKKEDDVNFNYLTF